MHPESTMIRFIQLLPQASPKGDFLLKDIPGSGKRIDILCRDLAACFLWGPDSWPRENLEMVAIIADSCIVTFNYPRDETPQSEVEWASIIKDSLRGQPADYIQVLDGTLEDVIIKYSTPPESTLWVLDENGSPISDIAEIHQITQNSFMLGDHRGFNSQTEKLINKHALPRVSLGKKSYLSSHCVAAIISRFERSKNARQ